MAKIHELIIILTDPQQKELEKKSKAAGNDNDHDHLHQHIANWLKPTESIGETLDKGLKARLTHCEK